MDAGNISKRQAGILEQCGRRGGAADLVTLLGTARGSEGREVAYTGFRHPCIIAYTGMGRFGFVTGRACLISLKIKDT